MHCWKCSKELPSGLDICPACQAPIDPDVVNAMQTNPEGLEQVQIVVGVLVANRYEIKREIGRGGMGVVYLAHDTVLDEDLALKILPPGLSSDPKAVKNLKREVSIARNLTHKNLVRLHNLEIWQGQVFVTMEYVEGESLAHYLADQPKGTLSLDQALPFLRQIAQGLDYAHGLNPPVVHRDIKPLNILLDGQNNAKLADFGLSRVINDSMSHMSNATAGSLAYMAPEQVRGVDIGPHSDVYALACAAYEMLAGHPPFHTGDLQYQIIHEEPRPIPGIAEEINNRLFTGLAKDGEDRPATAADYVAILAGEQAPRGRVPNKKQTATKTTSKLGLPAILIGLALLCLVAGGLFLFQSGKLNLIGTADDGQTTTTPPKKPAKKPEKHQEKQPLAAGKAILYLSSIPSGAKVYLGENYVGETPLEKTDLPEGTFKLRLTKEFYQPLVEEIQLFDNEVMRKKTILKKGQGKVTVLTTPAGATIWLDGQKQANPTPATLRQIEAGKHDIRLHLDTYYDVEQPVEVNTGETAQLDISFKGGDLQQYKGTWHTPEEVARLKQDAKALEFNKILKEAETKINKEYFSQAEQLLREAKKLNVDQTRVEALTTKLKKARAFHLEAERQRLDAEAKARAARELAGEFVFVKGGCYQMGDTFGGSDGYDDEKPVHGVCVDDFYMGKYEVTQGQYQAVMGINPSHFKNGDSYPVEKVSWDDAQTFIKKLNQKTGKIYRLPTEAEWEYAARSGGKREKYAGGNYVGAVAWYLGDNTHPVGQKKPNGLGLYDMSGNVWEWCSDWYSSSYYSSSPRSNPQGPSTGHGRVYRGGSWGYDDYNVRTTNRQKDAPRYWNFYIGFRLVLSSEK